jgi:threonine/homoserine/homoserine lactone efflux protein
MSLYGLAVFAVVYALAVASPGPAIAALIARVLGRGTRGIAAYIAGLMSGDLLWFILAATGLAVVAKTAYTVFVVLKFAGALYLLYLAWRAWTAPARPLADDGVEPARERPHRLFLGALALNLGNPKTMAFFLAILPTVVELDQLSVGRFSAMAAVMCCVLPAVCFSYVFFASRARKHLSSPQSVRWVQRGTGAVMAGAAIAVATR